MPNLNFTPERNRVTGMYEICCRTSDPCFTHKSRVVFVQANEVSGWNRVGNNIHNALCCPKGEPCKEHTPMPDEKVAILLKLNERLASQEKSLKLAYGEYGQLVFEHSPDTALNRAKVALGGYIQSISSLKTAIGVVKAL